MKLKQRVFENSSRDVNVSTVIVIILMVGVDSKNKVENRRIKKITI